MLHTGIQWEYLPQELCFGSGMTCWRRLAAWNEAGVWDRLHVVLLARLRAAKQLDWSRAMIDSSPVRAARRGPKAVPARSIAHGRAASTTSSSTGRASRSRCP
ncbi:transposase [Streptomyces sp. ISL-111]|nr:transposase [Streptomyces sp. ISL-111]